MAIPKLALIPSTVGGSVYSVLPSNGNGDFDFTRASAATRINAQGLIETVAVGDNRLNYPLIDGVVSGCPSLLLEPSRTNSVTYSEDFSNAFWLIQNASVTLNNAISPDGTLNANKLVENASNSTHRILNGAGLTVSGNVSMSIFAKKGERNWIRLTNNNIQGAFFDLENGVIGDVNSGVTANIEDFGNDWYRCSISQLGVANERLIVYISTDGINTSYQGDGTSGVYIYGAQLESNSSYPTSYIPTSGTTATRSAETCNNAGDVNTFNDSEGVLFAEIADIKNDDGVEKRLAIQDGGTFDAVRITFTPTTNSITGVVYNNGATQCNLVHVVSNTENFNKIALKYKANDFALWVNGIEVATDNSGTVFNNGALDKLSFDLFNNAKVYGSTKQIQYFDTALNDSDLETLTSWVSFSDMATSQLYSVE